MSSLHGKGLQDCWIANAERWDKEGRFAKYSRQQRDAVLRNGFLGRYPPDEAIKLAREQAERGYACYTSKFIDEMREYFGLVGAEVRKALLEVLARVPPESYKPPRELDEPPGYPFEFHSGVLGREVYLKFQIREDAKPQCLFWSCHPPRY